MHSLHPMAIDVIRFRLGSHKLLPIEAGRWNRTLRESRHCNECKVLGPLIERVDLNLSNNLSQILPQEDHGDLMIKLSIHKLHRKHILRTQSVNHC